MADCVPASGNFPNQAAVLIAVTDHPSDPDIIFTLRAQHLSTHSGEVSFPGGKWEDSDENLLHTALRESEEEIGLKPEYVEVLASLEPRKTRLGIQVTPFVGLVPADTTLVPNFSELDAIFRVPVSFFLADKRIRTDLYKQRERDFWAPAYEFNGYEIWGFTANILVTFLNRSLQAGISVEHSAPVRTYG